MTDPLSAIKNEMNAAIALHYPKGVPADLQAKIDEEFAIASSIDAFKGKGKALNDLHGIWKAAVAAKEKGDANASNSWIAYAIGLTDAMPSGATLPERRTFARASYPDIDSDIEDERREELVDHLVQKYGRPYVSNVGTYGTLNLKSLVRRLVKVFDSGQGYFRGKDEYKKLNRIKGDEIIATLPPQQGAKMIMVDDEGNEREIKTIKDAYDYVPAFRAYMDEFPEIMEVAQNLEGMGSDFSTHASGILISSEPLSDLAPVRPVTKKNWRGDQVPSVSTQFPYVDCEAIGLIKFDFLSLKLLSIFKRTMAKIKKKWDIDIDIRNLPLDDKKTLDMYKSGNLIGCFQVEKFGMQKTCREIAPDRFDDIVAAIALYRPGPLASIPEYVARKNGQKKVDYVHPSIEKYSKPILEKTYGVLVYQEQVMRLCNSLAGFSLSDAYQIIKAIGKKDMALMTKFGEQFVAGCVAKGVPESVARQYWGGYDEKTKRTWGFVVPFADYGFNASHSLCYGYDSYCSVYFKANYTEEYMCESLNVEMMRKKWKKTRTLEIDCERRNGIKILSRYDGANRNSGINYCGLEYEIQQWGDKGKGRKGIIVPPIFCQGLSVAAGREIVRARGDKPFKNIRDFANRTDSSVDTSSMAALIEAGFFGRTKGEEVLADFKAIREDLKKAAKKGVQSDDMFEGL